MRTLKKILLDVVAHTQENPTHGVGCACLDKFIGEIRRQIPDRNEMDTKESRNVSWVMNLASKDI